MNFSFFVSSSSNDNLDCPDFLIALLSLTALIALIALTALIFKISLIGIHWDQVKFIGIHRNPNWLFRINWDPLGPNKPIKTNWDYLGSFEIHRD